MTRFSKAAGASADYYGHADYAADIARGVSHAEIAANIDNLGIRSSNQSLMDEIRAGNVDASKAQGGGGQPQQPQQVDWGARFAEMQQQFQNQMAQYQQSQQQFQSRQAEWQQNYATAQADAAAKQQAWNMQQAQERQAHEAAMLAEARKVKTDTPTHVQQPASPMAIGPGRVSAPQSASSLGRIAQGTTPVVSGLNIGATGSIPGMPRPSGLKRTSSISA